MTITTTPQQVRSTHDEWRDRRWRLMGVAALLLWVAAAAVMALTVEKRSDLATLVAGIDEGSVTQVEVVAPRSDGAPVNSVRLRWQDDGTQRFVSVVEDFRVGVETSMTGEQVVAGSVIDLLRTYDRNLEVANVVPSGSVYTQWGDWRFSGWTSVCGVLAWGASVMLVIGGPPPWRATRWGWGWLVLAGGPIGSVAYLLLGGPLGFLRPRAGHRRLTGGWAFLIATVLFAGGNAV